MEERKLNEQESLALITSMINDTRERLAKDSGRPFLIWGYTTVLVSLLEYVAHRFGWTEYAGLFWFFIPVIGHTLIWLTGRKKQNLPKSYIDRCVSEVWTVLGVSCLTAVFAEILYGTHTMMFFSIILLIGSGTAMTGLIIKDFTTSLVGALSMLASLIFPVMRQLQPTVEEVGQEGVDKYISADILIFAAIFFAMLVIPGHILNYKNRRNKACSKH